MSGGPALTLRVLSGGPFRGPRGAGVQPASHGEASGVLLGPCCGSWGAQRSSVLLYLTRRQDSEAWGASRQPATPPDKPGGPVFSDGSSVTLGKAGGGGGGIFSLGSRER